MSDSSDKDCVSMPEVTIAITEKAMPATTATTEKVQSTELVDTVEPPSHCITFSCGPLDAVAAMAELEQYCILAKAQKGRACAILVQQLADSEFQREFATLNLFAYGTYQDYISNPSSYIELSDGQLNKLRQLSVLSLVAERQGVSYQELMEALGLSSVSSLEDLLISCIYANLLSGKLDQMRRTLWVSRANSRDVSPADVSDIIQTLLDWQQRAVDTEAALELANRHLQAERQRHAEEARGVQLAFAQAKADARSGGHS
eukprot:gene36830-44678_t